MHCAQMNLPLESLSLGTTCGKQLTQERLHGYIPWPTHNPVIILQAG